jgi:hypothetical protein
MRQSVKLTIKHPVPSLNKLFSMNPWQRKREKEQTQRAFMSALQASGAGLLTRITFARNTSLIAAGIAAGYPTIQRRKSHSKSAKSK